jgi:hypothetical protein
MDQKIKINENVMEAGDHSQNGASPKNLMSKRNKHSVLFFICLFYFCAFSTYAQETKLRIAVIDFRSTDNSYSYKVAFAKELTSIFTTELVNTNRYRVVERSRIEQVIKEQGLQSTQEVSARAVEFGKLLGVKKIITGETSKYGTTSLRLIDVESGDIEKAVTIDHAVRDKKGNQKRKKGVMWYLSEQEIVQKLLVELLNN